MAGRGSSCLGDRDTPLPTMNPAPLASGAACPTRQDEVTYSDIDLKAIRGREDYVHRSGEPYPGAKPRNPATGR
jgi:hypothetical protein